MQNDSANSKDSFPVNRLLARRFTSRQQTILVGLLGSSLFIGWIYMQRNSILQKKNAVRNLEERGARMFYELSAAQLAGRVGFQLNRHRDRRSWMRQLLGDARNDNPSVVGLAGLRFSDDDVSLLRHISSMELLVLSHTDISEEALERLERVHVVYR